jgi:hypothetical protein
LLGNKVLSSYHPISILSYPSHCFSSKTIKVSATVVLEGVKSDRIVYYFEPYIDEIDPHIVARVKDSYLMLSPLLQVLIARYRKKTTVIIAHIGVDFLSLPNIYPFMKTLVKARSVYCYWLICYYDLMICIHKTAKAE